MNHERMKPNIQVLKYSCIAYNKFGRITSPQTCATKPDFLIKEKNGAFSPSNHWAARKVQLCSRCDWLLGPKTWENGGNALGVKWRVKKLYHDFWVLLAPIPSHLCLARSLGCEVRRHDDHDCSEGPSMVSTEPFQNLYILNYLWSRWEIAVAAIRSGIILAPATTLLTAKDIQYRCALSNATVFIGDRTSVGKFLAVRDQCHSVQTVIQIGDITWSDAVSFYSALETVEDDATISSVRQDWHSPALIYFTSGTSGPPKMVQHNQISFPLGEFNPKYAIYLRVLTEKHSQLLASIGTSCLPANFFGIQQSKARLRIISI